VAQAQHQARRSLAVAAAFALAAPLTAVADHDTGAWLPLHVFLVGGLLSAISGTTQMLAVTWSASPAPRPAIATGQRWLLAAGAVAVAAGRELDADAVTGAGGLAVATSLVMLGASLVRIRRTAVTDRFAPAIDAYLVALTYGLAGTVAGVALAAGSTGGRGPDVRHAHLTVNVFGLVGLVILGTLPYFTATQARTKMSPLATPPRLRAVTALAALATAVAAGGHLAGHPAVAAAGLGLYVVAIAATLGLLPQLGRRQLDWAGPRLVQLGAGVAWWAITTGLLAADVARDRGDQGPVLRAMVVGGFAQILVASLSYLGPVLRGGGHRRLGAGLALTGSWPSLAAANVAAVGALTAQGAVLAAGLVVWVVDAAQRTVRLARG
jgi:nitrite reductase (NO-forming)